MKSLLNKVYLQGVERKSDYITTPSQQAHLLILAEPTPGHEVKVFNDQYNMLEC